MRKRTLNAMKKLLVDIDNYRGNDVKEMKRLLNRAEGFMRQVVEIEDAKANAYQQLKPKRRVKTVVKHEIPDEHKSIPNILTVKHQLCLPAPKEFIDELLEQIDKAVAEHNDKCRGKNGRVKKSFKWDTWEEVMNKRDNSFETKVNFILGTASDMGNIKSIYNKLANQYHPDKTRKNSNDEFAVIAEYYNLYK